MLEGIGERCKTAMEMSIELRPKWDGYLVVDEKMFRVRGKQQWYYVAVDRTGDIVHCRAVNELTVTEATSFLGEIRDELPYECVGVVTDLDTALTRAVEGVYAGKPHQYCLNHALRAIEKTIGYSDLASHYRWNRVILRRQFERLRDRKGVWVERAREGFQRSREDSRALSARYQALSTLREHCHRVLFARSEGEAREELSRLSRARRLPQERQRKAIGFLSRHWKRLMMYHDVRGLPRTNNLVESVNNQLEMRFKTIESFQHRHTAISYMNLLIAYLRQKPYTDCRGQRKHLNGKSRLEAAGVRKMSGDWLKNCLKPPRNSNR
jgi:transposase-like protein